MSDQVMLPQRLGRHLSRMIYASRLPRDLLEQAIKRIQIMALLAVLGGGLGFVLLSAVSYSDVLGTPNLNLLRPFWLMPILVLMAVTTILLLRWKRLSLDRRMLVGQGFVILSCLLVGLFRHWLPYEPDVIVRGPSPVAILILIFAALVPVRPLHMGITALKAAAMDPVALWLTVVLLDNPWPTSHTLSWLLAPMLLAPLLAVIVSRLLYSLGKSVGEARMLGSYQLVERLGGGGMGEVWRAHHQMLARPAAVKVINPEVLGGAGVPRDVVLARFEREAQATAALESHHTIELYDFGVRDDGSFYYAMELLDGLDLDTLVDRYGPLPPARVAHILRQVCHSLADAHSAGVIHRDIKPANIYLCRRGLDYDYVKVLDFGLVKFQEAPETAADKVKLTADGAITGTPAYMAPEMGVEGTSDARSDIYCLGCVIYWMLTGQLVFDGETPLKVLLAHLQKQPQRPSERLGRPIHPQLEALVMDCLAKEPEARPQSIDAVVRALDSMAFEAGWTNRDAREWWDEYVPRDTSRPRIQPTTTELAGAQRGPTSPTAGRRSPGESVR